MIDFIRGFWLALSLLTVVPSPTLPFPLAPRVFGYAVLWFPVIGLLIGGVIVATAELLSGYPIELTAILLLCLWVWLTGALHLDGVADCVDAWVGGRGNRERTLALLKDPRSGPMALVAIHLLLLTKWICLTALIRDSQWLALLVAPFIGRLMVILLLLTTTYVRDGGLGQPFSTELPRRAAWIGIGLMSLVLLYHLPPLWLLAPLIGLGWWRHSCIRKLGGITGDTLGVAVEITELLVLIVAIYPR